ncbi:hypothetical protein ACMZ5F_13130 [Streptomyces rhizosphaericola]|uniref:hypothetical protein n=1 Tax=Streptomyces TaxID=1883 RepID=UPI00048E84A3|nr:MULTISPECIES: hypothetical protein [unclassified Streptomyces]MYT93969.1 hypothetical protein [Streptomyces sp. SID8359]PWS47710.1 hypothetical protein DKT74_04410 [Streptomyces sp. ZEA17I]
MTTAEGGQVDSAPTQTWLRAAAVRIDRQQEPPTRQDLAHSDGGHGDDTRCGLPAARVLRPLTTALERT